MELAGLADGAIAAPPSISGSITRSNVEEISAIRVGNQGSGPGGQWILVQLQCFLADREHGPERIQCRGVVLDAQHIHQGDGGMHVLQQAWDAADHLLRRFIMATVIHPHRHACLVETCRFKVDEDHDDPITKCLGTGDEIDLGGMGIDGLETEDQAIIQE